MTFSTRLVFVVVALLTAPIASRGQEECDLPTQMDVEEAGGKYLTELLPEGSVPQTMTVHAMHFTCLATVALDKYSYASVVANGTSSADPPVTAVRQFQLQCSGGNWGIDSTSNFDANLPSDPFNIETEVQCALCQEVPASDNYNAITNCRYCDDTCEGLFCTSAEPNQCCQGFRNDTGACVADCTTIGPNFGPNDDFVCVCQIMCDPGHTRNITSCSCELTDGCEAYGQPCQNGGSCTSVVTASPPYSCLCVPEYTDENCTSPIPDCGENCEENQCFTGDCCRQCKNGSVLSTDNCTCVEETTTEPTRDTEPTCPSTCRDCDTDPTCCTACLDGYTLRSCDCVAEEGRSLEASQVAGIAIGLLLFILLILALAVLLAYVIYYVYDNKQKLKKGTALSPFSNGESHSNPLYLTPEEVED